MLRPLTCSGLMVAVAIVAGPGRASLACLPVPVQAMLRLIRPPCPFTVDNLQNTLVAAWWEYNGCTPFLAHNLTAKLVRRMVKDAKRAEGGRE